ncbi:MAG TPA: RQC domain-containing protein [Methanotrichaceae archaeon]|nr:RQC domain-containing protein [Methanotrichaceae archaeon]
MAQKILTCVSQAHEKFGANHIVDILRGSKGRKILQNGHDSLKAYGSGREYPANQWRFFIRELIQLGYLQVEGDAYPVLRLTEKSYDLLFGGEAIMLTKPAQEMAGISHDSVEDHSDDLRRPDGILDQGLFESLRALRRQVASDEGIPPYIVFHDSSLKEMAARLPRNRAEFRSIEGVGDKKLEKYGDIFLEEIDTYCQRSKAPEQDRPISVQDSSSEETAGTESENPSPEISCQDYETAFDFDPALAGGQAVAQGLKAKDDLSITHDNNIIEKLNRLEQQVEELRQEIGKIKDCIMAARSIDAAGQNELINQRQKN